MPGLVVTSHRTVTNARLTDLLSIGRVPCNNKCGSRKHGANCSGLSKARRHRRLLKTVFQSRLNYYASASKTSRRVPVPCGIDRDAHRISASGSEHTRHPFPRSDRSRMVCGPSDNLSTAPTSAAGECPKWVANVTGCFCHRPPKLPPST
jgi:hypothetical protein